MDRVFLADDDRPRITGLYLDIPGPAPSLDELRGRVEERVASLPVLHLTAGSDSTRWRDATPDLSRHVRHLSCPVGTLDAETYRISTRTLPSPSAPLWDLWLLTEPAADRYRLCLRLHHGLMEGVGIAHTAIALLGDVRVPGPYVHRPARPTLAAAARVIRDAAGSARDDGSDWPELSTHIDGPATWSYADTDVQRLTALARQSGATVNDVFLAALARAFRVWRENVRPTDPSAVPDLPIQIPMTVRKAGEEYAVGSRLVAGRIHLPVSAADPRSALNRVVRDTSQFSAIHYRDTLARLLTLPGSTRLIRAGFRPGVPYVYVSHVKIPGALSCFGSPVAAANRLPVSHHATWIGLTRVNDTARFNVVHNISLPDASTLPARWLHAVAELEDAVLGSPMPALR